MKKYEVTYTVDALEQEFSKKIEAKDKHMAEVLFRTGITLWGYKIKEIKEIT